MTCVCWREPALSERTGDGEERHRKRLLVKKEGQLRGAAGSVQFKIKMEKNKLEFHDVSNV